MLQVAYLRENKKEAIECLAIKNFDAGRIINLIIELDDKRKKAQNDLDNTLAQLNTASKQIGELFGKGKADEANKLKSKTIELKGISKKFNEVFTNIEKELNNLLVDIPNIPHKSVPSGKTSEDDELIFEEGNIPDLGGKAKPHWELAVHYDIIDFEMGSTITGGGFPVYKDKGAKLQRSLINFFIDKAVDAGYREIQPPILVNEASGFGTGQLPDKDDQMYILRSDNLYLSPTAEVPLTNMYRGVILKEEDLPIKIVAYTPCFRREAGSYGKDVKGLNRLHQFDKVEVVQIQHPGRSYEALEEMLEYVIGLLRQLELPFRVVKLCGGNLGFTSALTYDMEVYSAAQQKWLEVSSISNFETFQANRLKLRFRDETKKTQLLHTLNGSALALPRILAAMLENNQTPEGIKIPQALVSYTGFQII
ncbi:MAG: serine--tRNA ligase [Bacteroidota bacterium]